MTDTPALPGLPEPSPEPVELTDLEICTVNLQVSVQQLCAAMLEKNPDTNPADGAAAIGEIIGKTMVTLMHPAAARLGLLVAFEQSHDEPMNFVRVNEAKHALTRLAERRRKRDKTTAGGIILPGKP